MNTENYKSSTNVYENFSFVLMTASFIEEKEMKEKKNPQKLNMP